MNTSLRIDNLPLGSSVTLQFGRDDDDSPLEDAIFLGIEGKGYSRTAKFLQLRASGGSLYEWEAYRWKGRWAYGSDAEPVRVVSLDHTLAPAAVSNRR